jgi:hypothetical protein
MGWSLHVQLVEGRSATELAAELGGRPDGPPTDGLDALGSAVEDVWVGELPGWGVVSDPAFAFAESDHCRLSRGRRVLSLLLHTTATVYGVTWYVDGATVRRTVHVEGEPVESVGDALPEEDVPFSPAGEDWAPEIMQRLTGVTLGDIQRARFTRLARPRAE